jgi:hypothetical protein
MSWLYSAALVEEYLGENFLDGEQSAPSNGSHTQQAFCAPDKMMDFLKVSRFGMTFKPLTENLGEELLTLYREAFHVPTLVPQEKEQELTEKPLECGEKWRGSFTKYNPDSFLWKTHQCSLVGDLDEFLGTWPAWGSMRNGECWERQTLAHLTKETEFGFVPNGVDYFHTPNTTGLDGGSNSRRALKKRLLPTPDASQRGPTKDYNPQAKSQSGRTLQSFAAKFPTPQASDNRDRGNMSNPSVQRRVAIGKQISLSQSVHPTSGQLNPTWVAWLMGWPLGWSNLKPLEMGKSHFVPQQHGEFLAKEIDE